MGPPRHDARQRRQHMKTIGLIGGMSWESMRKRSCLPAAVVSCCVGLLPGAPSIEIDTGTGTSSKNTAGALSSRPSDGARRRERNTRPILVRYGRGSFELFTQVCRKNWLPPLGPDQRFPNARRAAQQQTLR
jgi:hypothetical protein